MYDWITFLAKHLHAYLIPSELREDFATRLCDCFSVERAKFGLEKDLLFSHLPLTSTRTYIHHTTLTLEEPNISLSIALEALR